VSDAAIALRDVTFAWGKAPPVLEIAALRIAAGERVLLKGPSGSGKSTLVALLAGVLDPQGGTVEVLGQDMKMLGRAARDSFRAERVGLIFQMFNLLPYLSIVENVVLPARFAGSRGLSRADEKAEARRLLGALGLDDPTLHQRPVATLSQGQQQRVAAARALFGRPGLLIADEPTSALDSATRDQFLDLLAAECGASNTTLLFVSHDDALTRHFERTLTMAELAAGRPD
jgi:putative ABC transport system ATP-binding protein